MRTYGGLAWMWLSACSTVTVDGRVVDGLTGQAIPGPYRIRASAVKTDMAMSCQFFDTEVGTDGRFVLDRLCPGTAYTLETDKEDLWLVGVDEAPDGGWGQPTDLTAWRVPKASGVYLSSKGEITAVHTDADVSSEGILKSDVRVRYPGNIPTNVARVGPEDHLILVGRAAVDELKFVPLVPSESRKLGTGDRVYTMEPWVYLGVLFKDDTTFESVEATLDPAGLVDQEKGDRKARYVSGTALPAGRYGLLKDDDRRMTILDFGAPSAAPVAPAVP